MAQPSAGGGGDPPTYIWVKAKGGSPIDVSNEGLRNVVALLEKVKERTAPMLNNVPLCYLKLYRSEQVKIDGGEAPRIVPLSVDTNLSHAVVVVLWNYQALCIALCCLIFLLFLRAP
jgi:hypothetical protein